MGDGFQFLDIIVFALVAGFLVLRLRSVLGRRTGNERRRDPFVPPKVETVSEKVVQLAPRGGSAAAPAIAGASPLPSGIAGLKRADPSFNEATFLGGARGAFEIIVNAFAAGDAAALQPLLSEAVYARFADAIRARRAAQEMLETTLLSIKAADIVER